jgi:glycosyltransferase involved in cell wall biosynthesis
VTRVGVVIPIYNHEAFVGDAVRSVLGQTVDAVELVAVDDGSKDASADAARDAIAAFPGRRARLIEQDNRGAHAAIMRGFAELDTPVCAVLNSDDLYEPDRFERMLPALDGPLAIAFSGLHLIDDAGRPLPPDHAWSRWYATALTAADTEPTIGFALLVHNFSVTSGNFVFTRALYDRLEGFGDQKFVHDWDFLIRSVALTEPVFLPDRLMRYRVHGANTTESVRGLMESECETAASRFATLAMETVDTNPIAPSGWHWPSYWDRFGRRESFFGEIGRMRWHAELARRSQ